MTGTNYTCMGQLRNLIAKIGRWRRRKGFTTDWSNVGEKLLLIHTEVSEAAEAWRDISADSLTAMLHGAQPLATDRDPVLGLEEELADVFIRLADLADGLGIDLEHRVAVKMAANERRPTRHGRQR